MFEPGNRLKTGVYRRASEMTMRILRANEDSLMTVLESFVHDPLVEWAKSSKKKVRSRLSSPQVPVINRD